MRFTLKKEERLHHKKDIENLFSRGKAITFFPVRMLCLATTRDENYPPIRIIFTVPKKKIRRAVHRNKVKRLMREAYRLRKPTIYEHFQQNNCSLLIAVVYLHHKPVPLDEMMDKIESLLLRCISTSKMNQSGEDKAMTGLT